MDGKTVKQIAADMLYPDGIRCIVCGRDLPFKSRLSLCKDCKLPENTEFCLGCGHALPQGNVYCDTCQRVKHPFVVARAPLVFTGNVQTLIRRLKYGNGQYLAPYLASLMAESYLRANMQAEAVAFVPMHKKRQRKRGYNQAELLAESLAEYLQLPVIRPLTRVKYTENLARMSKEARQNAITDAIACEPVPYKSVVLVDDVFTTGATASACAEALRHSGVKEVYVLTAATAKSDS